MLATRSASMTDGANAFWSQRSISHYIEDLWILSSYYLASGQKKSGQAKRFHSYYT